MTLTRRRFLGATALLGLAAGCGTAAPPAPAPAGPIGDVGSLVDWIAAHPDRASVLVDDGRGGVTSLNADRARPIASAGKVVHLTAYAQAVVAGTLDPAAPVTLADWESWYVPGTDGGAHPQALAALGGALTWDGLVGQMIAVSDSAVPDLIRARLGDAALVTAAAAGGWTSPDLPSYAGQALLAPTIGSGAPVGADRRASELDAARSYAADPAQRAAAAARATALEAGTTPPAADPAAELDTLLRWYDGSPAGTATQLAALHRAAATDALGAGVGAIVRAHLERGLAGKLPTGVLGAGQKGGNLPGLVSNAFTVRRDDGTVGVSVVSLSGLPWTSYQEVLASGAPLELSQKALLDAGVADRLRTAVAAS